MTHFGGCVLSLDGYRVEGNIWPIHYWHLTAEQSQMALQDPYTGYSYGNQPSLGLEKRQCWLCVLWGDGPALRATEQKQATLPSLWNRWKLEGLKAVKALLMLGILKFEISEPPCWTPEDLSQCALGAYSSVQKERSWLEGWKCAHRHFLLFSFHLGELQTLGNEGITGQTALCGTCHLARHWASPHRHRHMRIIEAGSSPDRELENRGTASLLSSTGEIQGWSKLV